MSRMIVIDSDNMNAVEKDILEYAKYRFPERFAKVKSDYTGYRGDKRRIEALPLTAEEHELAAKTAARRRGI